MCLVINASAVGGVAAAAFSFIVFFCFCFFYCSFCCSFCCFVGFLFLCFLSSVNLGPFLFRIVWIVSRFQGRFTIGSFVLIVVVVDTDVVVVTVV